MPNIENETDKFLKKHNIVFKKHMSYKEIPFDPLCLENMDVNPWKYTEKTKRLLKIVVVASKRLSSRQAECIRMHFYEGLSFKEIGKELHISQSSVRTYVSRAIYNLKKIIKNGERHDKNNRDR